MQNSRDGACYVRSALRWQSSGHTRSFSCVSDDVWSVRWHFQGWYGIYFVLFCVRCACFFAYSSMLRGWSSSRLAEAFRYWIAYKIGFTQFEIYRLIGESQIMFYALCFHSWGSWSSSWTQSPNLSLRFLIQLRIGWSSCIVLIWLKIDRPSLERWFICHRLRFWWWRGS